MSLVLWVAKPFLDPKLCVLEELVSFWVLKQNWYLNWTHQDGLFACSLVCVLGRIFLSWGLGLSKELGIHKIASAYFCQPTLGTISIPRPVPKSQMGTKVNLEPAPPSPLGSLFKPRTDGTQPRNRYLIW